ncbi:N-formylglutamate amidohydrolase [Actinoplanes sp. M2I2]|uniref:N-formylglutamate amidohydrolase n=1 Tax=Actinoplanes sp. M2I2 TaxID=1734444 RepID=UPI002020BE88|nr:N-formylglutamate amidohydrolase [Actinoplanes sp. M2I2]
MGFDVVPGDPLSPVILHVPHASRELTADARAAIVLSDPALADELDHLTDAYTDRIALRAADTAAVRPWIFVNGLSRLVVDPERFPDEREEMRAAGMGAVYTHGYAGRRLRDDDPVRDAALVADHYDPYAAAMTGLVAARLGATGRAVIIDVHSYPARALPYELHGDGPRPPVCLGADDFHTPPALLAGFGSFPTGVNTPFAGCYVPLRFYRRERAVSAVMVEIRRDTYLTGPGGAPHAGLAEVADALTALVGTATAGLS